MLKQPKTALYATDWWRLDAKTDDLTQAQYGAYRLLIAYYTEYGGLPATSEQRFTVARAQSLDEKRVCEQVLDIKFRRLATGQYAQDVADGLRAGAMVRKARVDLRAATISGKRQLFAAAPVREPGTPGRPPKVSMILPELPIELALALPVPAWMPRELWVSWIENRRILGAPNTHKALLLAIQSLEKLRTAGNQPDEVLRQSIVGGWRDLRPVSRPYFSKETVKPGEWWSTQAGICAKGKEIGVPEPQGKERLAPAWFAYFHAQVLAALGPGPWLDAASDTVRRMVAEVRPPSPPGPTDFLG